MAEYDKTNTGLLANNERKTQEKHPDLSGSINIDGKEYWVSGWKKVGRSGQLEGQEFISLAFSPKVPKSDTPIAQAEAKVSSNNSDDDLPF